MHRAIRVRASTILEETLKIKGTIVSLGLTAVVGSISLALSSERKHADRARPREEQYQGEAHTLDQASGAVFVLGPVAVTWLATRRLRKARQ